MKQYLELLHNPPEEAKGWTRIQYISGYAPYLIAGYSEEIAKTAQTDFAQMVQYVDRQRGASV